MIRRAMIVAWREFKHTALTKAFIIGVLIVPLFLIALVPISVLLFNPSALPLEGRMALIDPSGLVEVPLQEELTPTSSDSVEQSKTRTLPSISAPNIAPETLLAGNPAAQMTAFSGTIPTNIEIVSFSPNEIDRLRKEVLDGEFIALAIIPEAVFQPDLEDEPSLELLLPPGMSPNHTTVIEKSLQDAVVQARIDNAGYDYETIANLMSRPRIQASRLAEDGGQVRESQDLKRLIPIIFMVMLWIITATCGNFLLTSTIEEKSNRVMEVLLSAVSPLELMGGKLLGQALVSFVMLVMYGGLCIVGLAALAQTDLIPPIMLLWFLLYFIMAYFLLASFMAAIGSAVTELRDAQALLGPATIILLVPLFLWAPISEAPNGWLAVVTSYIPFLTPFVMILRVAGSAEPVAMTEIIATLIIGYITVICMIWAAARVFRVGVLMQGKAPSPLEMIRWIRYR